MANFITPSELKAYPLPVTAQQWAKVGDDQLAVVIGYACDHLEDYMDRSIATGNYVDRLTGSGLYSQLLSLYPVVALNYVSSYDGLNNPFTHDPSQFYVGTSGIIEWLQPDKYNFSRYKRWEFDYDAGYATVPGPVKHAAALQTVRMLQPLFRGGSTFTETELIAEIDEQIVELLEFYKRRRIS